MSQRLAVLLAVPLLAVSLFGQGLDTQATKDDWEEINFDYNSSVLVDGFPSLLRLAELLEQHPGYKVRIEGHTDGLGSDAFNQRLGLDRANTVREVDGTGDSLCERGVPGRAAGRCAGVSARSADRS